MELTPVQMHVFRSAKNWREFRSLFQTTETALNAHLDAIRKFIPDAPFTHQIEWRFIFHNKESNIRQLFALALLPAGVISTHHSVFRFQTQHALSKSEVTKLYLGRSLGALCYYLCFILAILCGVGIVVGTVGQVFSGINLKMMVLTAASLLGFVSLLAIAAKTRSLGLPVFLKPIAKNAFDLVSITKIKSS